MIPFQICVKPNKPKNCHQIYVGSIDQIKNSEKFVSEVFVTLSIVKREETNPLLVSDTDSVEEYHKVWSSQTKSDFQFQKSSRNHDFGAVNFC